MKDRIKDRQQAVAKKQARVIFLSSLLIIIAGLSVYLNSLNGKFVWDDEILIKNNPYIKSWSNLAKIFRSDIGKGVEERYYFYRPIQISSYLLDYSLYKLNPVGYHLTNILLHILMALLIYWLVNILFGNSLLALITSLLFVVHPIHTEAVSYISGRADLLASVWVLLGLVFYLRYLKSKRMTAYLVVFLSYLLAILSKECGLILPLLLLLYHYAFKIRLSLRPFFPILLCPFLYALWRLVIIKFLPQELPPDTLLQRLPGVFVALGNYIRLLVLPIGLHMEYGYKLFKPFASGAIFGYVILALLLFWGIKKRKANNLIFFSLVWFLITLLPQSNLYPLNAFMAEHWLYLPSMGFFLLLAYGLNYLYKTKGVRILSIIFLVGLVTFYSLLTIRQNNYWQEPEPLYQRTLRYAPQSSKALNNLGSIYQAKGRLQEAITLYNKAIEIDPYHIKAYNNLAKAYCEVDMTKEAITIAEKAIAIEPDYAMTYYNLANIYTSEARLSEAIAFYQKAAELSPDHPVIYNNLGKIYKEIGKIEESIASYKKAIELNPRYATAYNNMGIVLSTVLDKEEEAIVVFKKGLEIDPNLASAHNNLAAAYYYTKQYDLAIKHCNKAIELGYKVSPELLRLLEPYRK